MFVKTLKSSKRTHELWQKGIQSPMFGNRFLLYPNICVEKIRMCLSVPGLQSAQSRKAVLWWAKICLYMMETNLPSRLKGKTKIFSQISADPWSTGRSPVFRVSFCSSCFKVHFCAHSDAGNHVWHSRHRLRHTAKIFLQLWSFSYISQALSTGLSHSNQDPSISGSPLVANALKAPGDLV